MRVSGWLALTLLASGCQLETEPSRFDKTARHAREQPVTPASSAEGPEVDDAPDHGLWPRSLVASVSPDGAHVLVQRDTELFAVDPKTGGVDTLGDDVRSTAWAPRGNLLALSTANETSILDAHDFRVRTTLAVEGEDPTAGDHTFSWDGRLIASNDGRVWDTATGALRTRLPLTGYSVAWSEDSRYVASSGFSIQLVDVASGKVVHTEGGGCGGLAISPNLHFAAFAESQHDLVGWRFGSGKYTPTLLSARGCNQFHIHPHFTADSRVLYATGRGLFAAYEPGSWKRIGFYEPEIAADFSASDEVAAVSHDGLRIIVRRIAGTVFLWDAANLRVVTELPLAAGRDIHAFTPDGRAIITSHDDNSIELLSTRDGERLLEVALP